MNRRTFLTGLIGKQERPIMVDGRCPICHTKERIELSRVKHEFFVDKEVVVYGCGRCGVVFQEGFELRWG